MAMNRLKQKLDLNSSRKKRDTSGGYSTTKCCTLDGSSDPGNDIKLLHYDGEDIILLEVGHKQYALDWDMLKWLGDSCLRHAREIEPK